MSDIMENWNGKDCPLCRRRMKKQRHARVCGHCSVRLPRLIKRARGGSK